MTIEEILRFTQDNTTQRDICHSERSEEFYKKKYTLHKIPLCWALFKSYQRGSAMPWFYLVVAGLLEIVWAYTMKQSHGFSRLVPSVVTLVTMMGSFWLLSVAMRTIPLGTAYPVWTGIGAVGAFIAGVVFLAEPVNAGRLIAALLIISGLVLMKVSSP